MEDVSIEKDSDENEGNGEKDGDDEMREAWRIIMRRIGIHAIPDVEDLKNGELN